MLCAMLVSLVSCQEGNESRTGTGNPSTESERTTDLSPASDFLTVTSEFAIYCAEPKYTPAFSALVNRMREVTGRVPQIVTEISRIPQKNIIVGSCRDERYADYFRGLHSGDYFVEIPDADTAVLGGGTTEDLETAIEIFLAGCLAENPALKIGDKREHRSEPAAVTDFLLNGVSFGEYSICVSNVTLQTIAQSMRDDILSKTNEISPAIRVDSSEHPEGACIVIRQNPENCNEFSYRVYADGDDIILEGTRSRGITLAVEEFLEQTIPENAAGRLESFIGADAPIRAYCVSDQVTYADGDRKGQAACTDSGLRHVSSKSETISSGVALRTETYTDRNGKPVVVHAVVCEAGTVRPVCLLPGGTDTTLGTVATIPEMATSALSVGVNVCAAINGDFFYMGGSNLPTGYCYHNGVKLHETSDTSQVYSVFALLQDGSYYCGSWSRLCALGKQTRVVEVIGGRNQLLAGGHYTDLGYLSDTAVTEFSLDRFTRSAIGFDTEGRLYMVAVDKPGDGFSYGATLTDLAEIMTDLGATDAINLDGGGSTTLVIRKDSQTDFQIANALCVSTPRQVANGIGFVLTNALS